MFGWLLDHGLPQAVFAGSAALLAMGVLSAGLVAFNVRRRVDPALAS
jgi:hypothetical protein